MPPIHSRRRLLTGLASTLAIATAGCTGDDGDTATPTPTQPESTSPTPGSGGAEELAIEHLRLVAAEPSGYRQYTAVPDGTFDLEETVWIYFEPVGVATESAGEGQVRIDLEASLDIIGPDGTSIDSGSQPVEATLESDEIGTVFLYFFFIPPPETEADTFTAEVSLVDNLAGETVSDEIDVDLTGEPITHLTAFTEALTRNLALTVQSADETDGVVTLQYASDARLDSQQGQYQVEFIAGAYAELVGQTWDVSLLEAEVTDAVADVYQFEIHTDDAAAYASGQLTEAEYLEAVFASLEQIVG